MKKLALLSGAAFMLVLGLVSDAVAVEKVDAGADKVITQGWHHHGGGRRGRGGHWGGGRGGYYYGGGCW